ncbi:hypothetical protein HJG60_010813 [Phyllostomus discolor]|uniref:Uncharacterized protein n=1 Tax=Phyllostomus discolor TaxID=89673 RepID=A0A834E6E0_9CHIR|nr:hypothetical protein HJG60_010813 [Phyllostomus discolor]
MVTFRAAVSFINAIANLSFLDCFWPSSLRLIGLFSDNQGWQCSVTHLTTHTDACWMPGLPMSKACSEPRRDSPCLICTPVGVQGPLKTCSVTQGYEASLQRGADAVAPGVRKQFCHSGRSGLCQGPCDTRRVQSQLYLVQECLLASLLDPLENERWKWPIPCLLETHR